MHGSRKFCQRGSNSDNNIVFFLVDKGGEHPNTLKAGHHRPASKMTLIKFPWLVYGDPTLNFLAW